MGFVLKCSLLPISFSNKEVQNKVVEVSVVEGEDKLNWWVMGFTDGDGSFIVTPNKLNKNLASPISDGGGGAREIII